MLGLKKSSVKDGHPKTLSQEEEEEEGGEEAFHDLSASPRGKNKGGRKKNLLMGGFFLCLDGFFFCSFLLEGRRDVYHGLGEGEREKKIIISVLKDWPT